jgi:uncharacterized membrane protein
MVSKDHKLELELVEAETLLGTLGALLGVGREELVGKCKELLSVTSSEMMPGWSCPECRAFNGEAKKERVECRVCGALHVQGELAPEEGPVIERQVAESLLRENRQLREALSRVQGRSTEILEECRRLRREASANASRADVVDMVTESQVVSFVLPEVLDW